MRVNQITGNEMKTNSNFHVDQCSCPECKNDIYEPMTLKEYGESVKMPKQDRYLDEDGNDLIDRWAIRYTPEVFRIIMFAMMEKYQTRLGQKDSIAKECRKIADFANRLALKEEADAKENI
jgi:hypothetical protein